MLGRNLLCTTVLLAISSGAAFAGSEKIASRVLSDTANGASTEALVVLSEKADLRPAAALSSKAEKGRFVVNALRAVANRTQAPIRAMLEQRGIPYQSFYIVNMIKLTGNAALMQELADRPDVARIDANPKFRANLPVQTNVDSAAPGAVAGIEWNIVRVGAGQVWQLGYRGTGRVVGDNDTGVQWDHPALKKQYRGWNGSTANHDYNWHDATSAHSTTPIDPHGHGTFTNSELVGNDGAGNQVGVAPSAKWIACRNMDSGGTGSPSTYTECFEFMMAPYPVGGDPGQGDPTLAPDSINNSWTCPTSEGCSTDTLQAVVDSVRAAGIYPSMAAGNSGSGCSSVSDPPAIYDSSSTVGATTKTNGIAGFSSRGPVTADGSNRIKPDMSAPGDNIRGAVPGGKYQSGWSGTSMAAPHVAGGIALIWQAKPGLIGDVDATEALLESTTRQLGTTQNCGNTKGKIPNNTFGWGLINLYNAVTAP